MIKKKKPLTIYLIGIFTVMTITRIQAGLFISSLKMFGGESADAWLAPWVTDSILGLLLPLVIYGLLKGKDIKTWALILIYSVIGAFDYIHGFIAEWQHPLPNEMASKSLVYSSLIVSFAFQFFAIVLLFRASVITYFISHKNS